MTREGNIQTQLKQQFNGGLKNITKSVRYFSQLPGRVQGESKKGSNTEENGVVEEIDANTNRGEAEETEALVFNNHWLMLKTTLANTEEDNNICQSNNSISETLRKEVFKLVCAENVVEIRKLLYLPGGDNKSFWMKLPKKLDSENMSYLKSLAYEEILLKIKFNEAKVKLEGSLEREFAEEFLERKRFMNITKVKEKEVNKYQKECINVVYFSTHFLIYDLRERLNECYDGLPSYFEKYILS